MTNPFSVFAVALLPVTVFPSESPRVTPSLNPLTSQLRTVTPVRLNTSMPVPDPATRPAQPAPPAASTLLPVADTGPGDTRVAGRSGSTAWGDRVLATETGPGQECLQPVAVLPGNGFDIADRRRNASPAVRAFST
jgi:hypothetical protein